MIDVWHWVKPRQGAHHGGSICRFYWRLSECAIWARCTVYAGAVAAALVTWFTFLPSFIFILLVVIGESTHAISISPLHSPHYCCCGRRVLNLALFLLITYCGRGASKEFRLVSALIAIAAAVALLRYKRVSSK